MAKGKEGKEVQVLIVPLWNWNADISQDSYIEISSSNCTFMELKLPISSLSTLKLEF